MAIKEHLKIMIDLLEYYVTKEIEHNVYGTGDICYVALYDRLAKCIHARKEIDYIPYESVSMLLKSHGYDEEFIEKFLSKVNAHKNNCEN